ncbi:MAG TPA: DUF1844 domain-containing protein [Pyrinomonadaceae bacterium]|jgi:hypothetical protein
MSEEKPVFKVKDRRLFNPDGTPREVEREDEPTRGASSEATPPSSSAASTGDASARAADTSPRAAYPEPPIEARQTRGGEQASAADAGAASDPTAFVNLLMFIASPAAAALGISEHPDMPAHDTDLPFAKHCIDLLGTLRQKTKGNLIPQEEQIFEGLLAELRMQYVALSGGRPAVRPPGAGGRRGGGGFSGSDITGGR